MELAIPITKKQHDAVRDAYASIESATTRLSIMAATIVAGQDQEIPQAAVVGARCTDGGYALILALPDPSPVAETDPPLSVDAGPAPVA